MATQAQPYIPNFGYQPQSYAVHNASPDPVSIRWAGLGFTVPGCEQFSPNPAIFDDGAPIPGTLSLSDAYTFDASGNIPQAGSVPNWFAAEAVKAMLGIDTNGIATSPYSKRGISVLPHKPSRETVQQILEAGRARYQEFLVEWAQYTIMAWQEQAERSRRAGVAALPPGPDYHKAVVIVEKHNEEVKKHLGIAPKAAEIEDIDDDLEFQAFATAEALMIAKKIAADKDVDLVELAEKMLENPKIRIPLQKKWSIRKRGHLEEHPVGEDA